MKQRILSLLVLLAAAVSGAWAIVPTFEKTIFETTETLSTPIYVTENTEITIADGAILTINGGLIIEDNASLTVNGPGKLVVNGTNGSQGSQGTMRTGNPGGAGTDGSAAITGNIVIKGATVEANGGYGGNGGRGGSGTNGTSGSNPGQGGKGGKGGKGAAAFTGAVTIFSGTITAKGGYGGDGGSGGEGGSNPMDLNNRGPEGDKGDGGDGGNAFAGTLTFYGGTVKADGARCGYGKPDGNTAKAFANDVTMNAATYELRGSNSGNNTAIEFADILNYRFVDITAADYVESTFDYELTVEASDHGSGTISYTVQDKDDAEKITENAKGANEGDKVTVTITPDEGWWVADPFAVTAEVYRYWEGSRRAQATVPMQRTVDLKYERMTLDGVAIYTFTMPASNVKVKGAYKKISTLYFDPADRTNLMKVNVDSYDVNVEDGKTVKIDKVEDILEGKPVTLTANTGYKFRKVEVKKGGAADNAYLMWDATKKELVEAEIPATVTTVEEADENVTWEAGTYVVDGEVTINGTITLNGDVELIIKDGAKLTAKKIQSPNNNNKKNFRIYGQANQSGQLVVNNPSGDAIAYITTFEVHSCQVTATSPGNSRGGFYGIVTFNVYGGSVDAEYTSATQGYGIYMSMNGSMNIYGGDVKAVGKGTHPNYSYGITGSGSITVTVYGGKLWAECASKAALHSAITLTKGVGFSGKIETSDDGTTWTDWTTEGTPETKYVRVGY